MWNNTFTKISPVILCRVLVAKYRSQALSTGWTLYTSQRRGVRPPSTPCDKAYGVYPALTASDRYLEICLWPCYFRKINLIDITLESHSSDAFKSSRNRAFCLMITSGRASNVVVESRNSRQRRFRSWISTSLPIYTNSYVRAFTYSFYWWFGNALIHLTIVRLFK